ncbi:MAG: DUF4340 domain-containing protein [Nitrospirota bacterium]
MRQAWLTILMALVLAGLGAYVYWVELPAERKQADAEAQEKKLLPFEEREITGLTVRTDGSEVVLAAAEPRTWRITAPMQTEADAREVDAMVRALALGKVSRVVQEQAAALAPFGLEKPPVVLTVSAGSRQETLSLGDSGPISSTLYALRGSDRKVLLTTLAPKDFLNKTLLTFRKKEVLRLDQGEVDRVRLTSAAGEIVLYRSDQASPHGPAAPAAGRKWKVVFPIEAEADQAEARGLLLKLEDLKALGFVDPGSEQAALLKRLTTPAVKITVHTAGGDQTVKLFQPDPASGEAYAVTAPEAPVYRVSPQAIRDFTKELFTLQDKRLLGMNLQDVAILSVKTREEQYVLINQSGTWVLEDQPAEKLNQEKVALFVSRVADLPAEIRVVKQAGPLAPYGLSSPAAEFTATGKDGKTKGRLILGTKTGGLVYAIGQGLPGIHQARSDLLSQIPAKRELPAGAEPGGGTKS